MSIFQPIFRIVDKDDYNRVYYSIRRHDSRKIQLTSSNGNMLFNEDTPIDTIVKFILYKIKNHIPNDNVSLKLESNIGFEFQLASLGSASTFEDLAFACRIVKHLEKVQDVK